MNWRVIALLIAMGCARSATPVVEAGTTTTVARVEAGTTGDAGELVEARDPAMLESLEREREDRLMRARAFDARADLERRLAGKEKRGPVKHTLLEAAKRLTSLADDERRLAGPPASLGD